MNKIAILITTFLRDNLLYKTIQTIVDNYTENCIILIADQGYSNSEKDITLDYYRSQIPLEYYRIPFDSGLAYARNFLINKTNEMKIPYIFMDSDSIQFIDSYDFEPFIKILEFDKKLGLIGFDLMGAKCPWEFLMEITPKGIKMLSSKETVQLNGHVFKKVDICRNIFLAKTNTMLKLYDEEMKLCEHELAFLEYKKRGYKVYWTNSLVFQKINIHNSNEYETYRKRFGDYQKLLKQKLGINGWVIYSSEAMKEIKEYQNARR